MGRSRWQSQWLWNMYNVCSQCTTSSVHWLGDASIGYQRAVVSTESGMSFTPRRINTYIVSMKWPVSYGASHLLQHNFLWQYSQTCYIILPVTEIIHWLYFSISIIFVKIWCSLNNAGLSSNNHFPKYLYTINCFWKEIDFTFKYNHNRRGLPRAQLSISKLTLYIFRRLIAQPHPNKILDIWEE